MKELMKIKNQSRIAPSLSGINRQTAKELMRCHDEISKEALLISAKESARTALVQNALLDTVSLEMTARQLSHLAPLAKPRLAMILDAHTASTVNTIVRF